MMTAFLHESLVVSLRLSQLASWQAEWFRIGAFRKQLEA
jgi:hypothetical protein